MQGLYKHNLPRDIKLYLAKPNREIIAPLTFAYQRTITWNEDSPSELSFSLPYEINVNHKRKKYEPVTQLKEKFLIKAVTNNYEEWFIITNPTTSEDDTTSLSVNCLSAEQTLAKKKLIEFKRTSYNPLMLLNDILPGTGYTAGYINPKLNLKYREFDISSTSKLDFIYTDMTDTYEALAVFDTVDKTVSLYEKNELSDYKGFIVNDRRYLMGIENDIDTTELVTRLHVTGSDGLGIQSVNPTGQRYIDDFSYFLYPFELDKDGNVVKSSYFMEDDLAKSLVKYNEYVSGRKDEFKNYLDKKVEEQQELTKLQTDLFDADTELKTVLDSIAWMKEEGLSTSDKQKERKELNTKVKKLNSEIKEIENTIEKINEDIKQLGEDLRYDNHLSSSQMEQLNYFIHEEEWSDGNKIDPNDLYESGIEELKERNSPPVNMSVTLANFLKDAKAENDWKRLNLSDIVRIQKPKLDIDVKVRVSSITIDFDTPSINLELSNYKELNSWGNKLKSVFYRVNKVNTDFNKRKIDYDRVANNFNLRNDRIKEIPEEPTVGKNAIKHRKNNDGSVDITVKWTYPDYAKTDKKEHAIDGFMLYFHNDTEDEVYQFTSQMANEQISDVPYPTRTFVYPSVPADLFYTIGVRAYRRVDPDVNRDGILMSPIIRFNDGVGGFDEIEGQSLSTFSANVITPLNESNDSDDISSPYRPEEFADFLGKINGSSYKVHHKKPDNPGINDVWINSANGTLNIWNGEKWQGNQILADLGENVDDLRSATNTFENELREKLEESQKAIDEAMERVDSEMDRIENEVVPEVEQAVKDTFVPRQEYPPDPENMPPSGIWQDISQDPPRMMRWDEELGEWVPLAPTEEEIDEQIDKIVEDAKQEYREYTDEEIQKERDRILKELEERESVLGEKVSELLNKAEGMYDRVDEIDQELIDQQDRVNQMIEDLTNKPDMEWVDERISLRGGGIVKSSTPPEDPEDSELWLDTSKVPNILSRWNGESWEKAAPTDAGDLNAYTITEIDEALNAKVSSDTYLTDKDGILDELQNNESRISQNEKEIESRVSESDYNLDKEGFLERFEENEASITNNAKEISFKASQESLDTIENTVEDHSAQLSVQAGLITSKVDSIYVDGKIDEVENEIGSVREYASSIEQTAESIDTSLSSLQQSHDNLGEKVDKNSTDISIQAGLIEGKLDSITYTRDKEGILESIEQNTLDIKATAKGLEFKADSTVVDNIEEAIAGHTTELELLATGLRSKVDETFVRDAIDGIEVGGRNHVPDSQNLNQAWGSGYSGANITYEKVDMTEEWGFSEAYHVKSSGGNGLVKGTWGTHTKTDLVMVFGQKYTFSMYIKNIGSKEMMINTNGLLTENSQLQRIPPGHSGRLVVAGGTRREDYDWFQVNLRTDNIDDDIDIIVGRMQVEEGNTVTPWSPASEDILSVQEHHSTVIDQNSREIALQANSISKIQGDVSSAESSISILSDEINNRVKQVDFNNETGALRESISSVRQLANGIEQTVSNIQIGSNNLIPNSKGDNLEGWGVWGNTDSRIVDGVIRVRKGANSTFGARTQKFEVESGKVYTLSLDIASNYRVAALNYMYLMYDDGTGNYRLPDIVMTNAHPDLRRYSVTFTPPKSGMVDLNIATGVTETDFQQEGFLLSKVQIENGNMETPWKPAIEDTDRRMTQAESNITQLSDQISFKVEKDGIISSINQTPEKVGINASLIDFSGLAKFEPFSKNYYQSKSIANGSGGRWYRIAKNTGSRAHAKFMLRDTTPSQHGTAVFEAGVNYSNRPYINLTSYGRYSSASFSQARILTNTTYDEVYLEIYINNNARTQNLAYWITENVQNSGWVGVNWTNGSIPSGYSSFNRNIDSDNVVQGTVDKWKYGNTTLINGGEIYTNSITATQLNVNNIFGNSAVIEKIQSDSVLTAKLSATNITTGTLNANNVSVVNLSASSLTSGTLDASKVTVRNLDASSVKTGVLSAIDIEGVNITGSSVISQGNDGSWIRLADGRIDMMNYGTPVGYLRAGLTGTEKNITTMGIVGMRSVVSIGFDVEEGFGGSSESVALWDQDDREAIISGADSRSWNGRLRLRSSYHDRDGNHYVPHIDIDNNTWNGIPYGNVMMYVGRNNNSPSPNSRYGFEIWQYNGTGDGSATRMFKTDYSTTYSSYVTDVADRFSIGYNNANDRRFMIKYDGDSGDTIFQTLDSSNIWTKRLAFKGRSGSNGVEFSSGEDLHLWGSRNFASGTVYTNGIMAGNSGRRSPDEDLLYIGAQTEVRVTQRDGNNNGNTIWYRPIRASSHPTSSSIKYKSNVEELSEYDTMRIFHNANIVRYHLNGNLNERIYDKPKIGMISEAVPQELRDEDGVDPYSIISTLWKVVQIKDKELNELKKRVDDLEEVINYML